MSGGRTALLYIKSVSRRVPDKNFRDLGGKPLFWWIVATLDRCESVGRVIIDTDCPERITLPPRSSRKEIQIVRRGPGLAEDHVVANTLIERTLATIGSSFGSDHGYAMAHATSPFLQPETLDACDRALGSDSSRDSAFSVTRQQRRYYDREGRPLNHDPARLIPTQELEPLYEENSAFYLFSRDSFVRRSNRIGSSPLLFPISPIEALDIDTEEDWKLAEAMARSM